MIPDLSSNMYRQIDVRICVTKEIYCSSSGESVLAVHFDSCSPAPYNGTAVQACSRYLLSTITYNLIAIHVPTNRMEKLILDAVM